MKLRKRNWLRASIGHALLAGNILAFCGWVSVVSASEEPVATHDSCRQIALKAMSDRINLARLGCRYSYSDWVSGYLRDYRKCRAGGAKTAVKSSQDDLWVCPL